MIKHLTLILAGISLAQTGPVNAQEDNWESVAPMPTARESPAACVVNDQIYVVGGFPGGSDTGRTTNERYDPATNSWTVSAPMSDGRRMPVTGTVGDKCYVIGGRVNDRATPRDTVEEYDSATNSWRARASMPTARFGHAAAVVDGIIYVVGGTSGLTVYPIMEAYNPATDSWTTLAPMNRARALHGAAAANGKIYVMGGTTDGATTRFASMEVYDPATDTWTSGAEMPLARFSLRASTANGRIYAIGGTIGSGALNDVTAYDPITDTWTTVSPMITRRARFASAVVGDKIYAIGGTNSFGNPHVGMDLVERYTPAAAELNFLINPGLNDAWYNPATDGQGFLFAVFPEIKLMFVAWFTFDTERPPEGTEAILGDAGHRWLTAQGPFSGNIANLTIYETEGGRFDAAEPAASTDPAGIGQMTIEFADCSEGLVSYEISSPDLSGEIPIERILLDNVPLCEALSGQ